MRPLTVLLLPVALGVNLSAALCAQGDTKQLVAELGSANDSSMRYAAYRSLLAGKPKEALALLVVALPGYGLHSQSLGISLLQTYPSDKSFPALEKLMATSAPYLQLAAAAALYRRGRKSSALPVMLKALDHAGSSTQLASYMLTRISYIKEPLLHEKVRLLIKPSQSIRILDSAFYHLLNARDRGAIPAVVQILDFEAENKEDRRNPELRALCATFLVALGETRYSKMLADAITHGDVRFSRLYRHLNRAPKLDRNVLDAILEVVKDNSIQTYQLSSALRILGKHGHGKALRVIRKLIKHKNMTVAKAAADAMTAIGGSLNTGSLHKMLAEDNADIALMAAELLRKMDDRSGLPKVLEILKRGGKQKAAAVRILGGFRVQAAVRPLIEALMDEELRIRSYALSALSQVLRSIFPYRRLVLAKTGYAASRSLAVRKEAVDKILAWWQKYRPKKR